MMAAALAAKTLMALGTVLAMDPLVPFDETRTSGIDETETELRKIHAETGLRRFFITAPGFGGVMYGPFADDLYAGIGRDIAELKRRLADTDIEVNWWCSPSIRYFSDFPSIEDPEGHKSVDNKKCPLDPAFAADWAAKVKSVAKARPKIISIEDDYTLAWGRGLTRHGACFCKRHLALFAKLYGKALTGPEIAAAFENRTPENLKIRRAFADAVRESLVSLAKTVRAAVDEVDPTIRIALCESGNASDKDGDALEAIARAFAGKTRPVIRPSGAIYGAETTPAAIPSAVSHTMWTLERLPEDVETYYEADPYPHNRFYSSASQMASQMTGAMMMGSDDIYLYCLQYLDDPFEDPGYARAYLRFKPRMEAVRDFIRTRRARLAGVRNVWTTDDLSLVRGFGYAHGGQLHWGAYLLSKFGIPYTTRRDAKGPAILAGGVVEVLSDEELKAILSGGALVDAVAAELVVARGFGDLLGTGVEPIEGRPRVTGETILPAAGCARPGRKVNAFDIFCAGTEGTVERVAKLAPRPGTEVWSEFTDPDGKLVTPSLTFATNALGGRVAVLATSLLGNRSSGLYNLRKQELFQNLFRKMSPEAIPVEAVGVPGIWTLAQVAEKGDEMLVMVNNLSGDEREDVVLAFAPQWAGATVARLGDDGARVPLGTAAERWTLPRKLGQMEPEFLVVTKKQSGSDGVAHRTVTGHEPIDFAKVLLDCTTDKSPISYHAGEEMTFTFTLDYGQAVPPETQLFVRWFRSGDDGLVDAGMRPIAPDRPVTVKTSIAHPGFVRMVGIVTDATGPGFPYAIRGERYANRVFEGGAGADVDKIRPARPAPKDFDSFWAGVKRELASVPVRATVTDVDESRVPESRRATYRLRAVRVDCAGRAPVTGFLITPKGAVAKSLPVTVLFDGYGPGCQGAVPGANEYAAAEGKVYFHVNAHGYELMREAGYYKAFFDALNKGNYGTSVEENAKPETSYFKDMAMRVIRAFDFAKTLPEWNGKDLVAEGMSQGGAQTTWAGSLVDGLTVCRPRVTWLCDLGRNEVGRMPSWPAWAPGLDYFDGVNHARRIPSTCRLEIAKAGLGDTTCPGAGLACEYNAANCPKSVVWWQNATHLATAPHARAFTNAAPAGCAVPADEIAGDPRATVEVPDPVAISFLADRWTFDNGSGAKPIAFSGREQLRKGRGPDGKDLPIQHRVRLSGVFTAERDGVAMIGTGADWWWTASVNGKPVFGRGRVMPGANGGPRFSAEDWTYAVPVKKGENTFELEVFVGGVGFVAVAPAASGAKAYVRDESRWRALAKARPEPTPVAFKPTIRDGRATFATALPYPAGLGWKRKGEKTWHEVWDTAISTEHEVVLPEGFTDECGLRLYQSVFFGDWQTMHGDPSTDNFEPVWYSN